ncbi:hypothetical protein BG000_010560 [Podila horticola]|nr:hypothetical protein BG003_008840 [Podila horticola]KAG0331831.1 hypothetical protein BG000_010560 [Podila horticola]
MRTSLFLAVASVLVASVAAHEGPHDPTTGAPAPTGAPVPPSVCLTTPTDASCATYNLPNATLTTAISDICKTSSFLPGCSLNTACAADASLPAAQCAPLTILATLCGATDDVALTSAVCSKTYNVFCSATSLIAACKTQKAFPGLPSGKAVTGTVYSICQSMASMTDCKICPAPEGGYSKCDEVSAWKGLCLDMPDMPECPSYNAMCKATPFAPFCTAAYKAPGTPTTSAGPAPTGGDHSGHGSGSGNKTAAAIAVSGSYGLASAMAVVAVALAF